MANLKQLTLKYRPRTFDDLVEQYSIRTILDYQLQSGNIRNSYLFTGPAGCGKTTSARIFASQLNNGSNSYIELDGASNNSVDDIRKIIDEAKFKDLTANYKIYIIDECHQLSSGAWAALLKLLEEPPLKTIFILCTTDAQKIPNTILSRVQRFDFKRISYEKIVDRLEYILNQEIKESPLDTSDEEEIKYTKDAIEYIARIADGGMRDAITLLDKCLSFSKHLTSETVTKALDFVDMNIMFDLTNILYNRDLNNLIELTESLYRDGTDIKLFTKQYLSFILNLVKLKATNNSKLTNLSNSVIQKINATEYDKNFLLLLLDWLLKLNELIRYETSPKTLFQANMISFIKE